MSIDEKRNKRLFFYNRFSNTTKPIQESIKYFRSKNIPTSNDTFWIDQKFVQVFLKYVKLDNTKEKTFNMNSNADVQLLQNMYIGI